MACHLRDIPRVVEHFTVNDIYAGSSAFPIAGEPGQYAPEFGMTLRDYFAAKAMMMFVNDLNPRQAAEMAYMYANEMLAARGTS
jgi:hypothetical protein